MKFYDNDHKFENPTASYSTEVSVVTEDTFTVAANVNDPCCLNFASHKRPGGGYESVMNLRMPIRTQEEDLFRRSDLPKIMDTPEVRKNYYPLMKFKGLYCETTVTKDKALDLINPFKTGVITLAAVVNPQPQDQYLVIGKVRRVFEIAADVGHKTLILGAWGCGVFRNDPLTIAELFDQTAKEFDGVFERIIYAVPNETSANYQIFKEVHRKSKKLKETR